MAPLLAIQWCLVAKFSNRYPDSCYVLKGKLLEKMPQHHFSESNFLIVDRSGLKSAAINFSSFSLSRAFVAINSNYRLRKKTHPPSPLFFFCFSATFHWQMFQCQMLAFLLKSRQHAITPTKDELKSEQYLLFFCVALASCWVRYISKDRFLSY